jgi:Tol biopolymer transport system component
MEGRFRYITLYDEVFYMLKRLQLFYVLIGFAFLLTTGRTDSVFAQRFGKNKLQYQKHDWKYMQSQHFDIYYYKNNLKLAEFTADVAESSFVQLRRDLRFKLHARVPIVVYNSHNDFESTNVLEELIEESVGGFTEVFKDRVVIPFQGSYADFRHVIHHELTHAIMFQTFYGGKSGSILSGMMQSQVPLWFAEGLAEYQSLGWDTESDMYMRDGTFYDYVPPIESMYGGFMVYKGGQSIWRYLADKYGAPKVGEIITKVQMMRDLDKAFKESIGLKVEELSKRWHKYLHQNYWPDIQGRDEPGDISRRLTDHEKKNHFLNSSPALSPKGDKLAYLTDRSGFIDIHLMNTLDGKDLGKLVQGERSDLFEEMHWTRPGMKWSPDGEKLVFAAKAGGQDALYILDILTKTIVSSYQLNLDGIFSPDWSPDGNRIVFMGIQNGQSDLYELKIKDGTLNKLTDDIFSDMDPVYSPTGEEIAFISDRSDFQGAPPESFRMQHYDYRNVELYTINLNSRQIQRRTRDTSVERSPSYSPDGKKIAFVSDRSGINNIYVYDSLADSSYAITNLVSGVTHLSWAREGSRLAFASFDNGGFDIYLMTNPLDIKSGSVRPKTTRFVEEKKPMLAMSEPVEEAKPSVGLDYRNFIFDERFRKGELDSKGKNQTAFLDSTQYKNSDGGYKTHKYKIRFSPDLVTGGAGYSQFWGLQGSSFIRFSDVLGNHQIDLYTNLFYNLKNSNFQFSYSFLPLRVDIGVSVFHYSYRFYTWIENGGNIYFGYLRDRNYGLSLFASRPFDRYRRLDVGLTALGIDRDLVALDEYYYYYYYSAVPYDVAKLSQKRILMANVGYTTDTAIFGSTGPMSEGRSNITLSYSPKITNRYGLDFWTLRGDFRRYYLIGRNYAFAFRMAGGVSGGGYPQKFLLGGMLDWVNYKYRRFSPEFFSENNFFFSTFETPLRGTLYYEMIGTRFMLTNIEFRFPLIQYLILGWPLPIGFQNIRGVMFMDLGSAWDNDKAWKPFTSGDSGMPRLNDLRGGFGLGVRMNLGYFILRYDYARATDFASVSKDAVHYFSFGADF